MMMVVVMILMRLRSIDGRLAKGERERERERRSIAGTNRVSPELQADEPNCALYAQSTHPSRIPPA